MKKYMFQYATKNEVIEDTGLITLEEAEELWEKYLPDIKDRWDNFESPEMCIWSDCDSETDYHTQLKDIDFRDCELKGGVFYRVTRERI